MENNTAFRREKVFFASGDLVELKQSLPNKPIMLVHSVDKLTILKDDKQLLLGVTCIWFTKDGALQKSRFSTKDLTRI